MKTASTAMAEMNGDIRKCIYAEGLQHHLLALADDRWAFPNVLPEGIQTIEFSHDIADSSESFHRSKLAEIKQALRTLVSGKMGTADETANRDTQTFDYRVFKISISEEAYACAPDTCPDPMLNPYYVAFTPEELERLISRIDFGPLAPIVGQFEKPTNKIDLSSASPEIIAKAVEKQLMGLDRRGAESERPKVLWRLFNKPPPVIRDIEWLDTTSKAGQNRPVTGLMEAFSQNPEAALKNTFFLFSVTLNGRPDPVIIRFGLFERPAYGLVWPIEQSKQLRAPGNAIGQSLVLPITNGIIPRRLNPDS